MKFFEYFYNPFKPHIASLSNGRYVIRRLGTFGWEYLDSTSHNGKRDNYWWTVKDNVLKYCGNSLKVEAEARLNEYKKPTAKKFSRKV
jgi:hypothetical protein